MENKIGAKKELSERKYIPKNGGHLTNRKKKIKNKEGRGSRMDFEVFNEFKKTMEKKKQ